jgi:dolichyl-phosphate beta-glucosyltransferase
MPEDQPYLSIVIPAYNEEQRIGKTLDAVERYLQTKPFEAEVIVVSDGSRDDTVAIVSQYASKMPNLRLIANEENRGKGYVVRQGMLEAKGALRLFTDADNATPIEELDQLLRWVKQPANGKWQIAHSRNERSAEPYAIRHTPLADYDVAIGSIGLKESKVEKSESGIRALAGKIANLLIQFTVLPGIHDTQRGFKLFTAEAAEDIFSRTKIDRWGFDIEALALARKLRYRIREVPIRWIHDPRSHVKSSAYLKTLWDLARIRFWLWTDAYHIRRREPLTPTMGEKGSS